MGWAVLVVEDDEIVSSMLGDVLTARGQTVRIASDVGAAKKALDGGDIDVVVTDMYLPDGNGLEVLTHALSRELAPPVVVMTARADIRGAVEAVRKGASDYIEKPFDVEDVSMRLTRALEASRTKRKLALYEEADRKATSAVVQSRALEDVFSIASRVAATPASSAMILGESGVGKEVLAAHIHETSARRNGPFIRVNMAAIPESMIEAELFGSVRGAFTDSKKDRAGLFAMADGGTLLLDELCEFKVELQPKLLRVLEERRYFPVGSERERRIDVRVLAATNRDPAHAIAEGRLREDLYYRLSTVVLRIPPLRERADDIVPLAEHFLGRYRAEFGRPAVKLADSTRDALRAYSWPGNVRELRNTIERATMLAVDDLIEPADLQLPVAVSSLSAPTPMPPQSDRGRLDDAEREHIERVLRAEGGSRTRTAATLGISRSTLWEKLKKYGLA